jgi:hypothetical protein
MLDQVVLTDHAVAVPDDVLQEIEHLRLDSNRLTAAAQFLALDIEAIVFEPVDQANALDWQLIALCRGKSGKTQRKNRIASRTPLHAGAMFWSSLHRDIQHWRGQMMKLGKIILAAIMFSGTIAVLAPAQAEEMTKERLVGTWQAVSFKTVTGEQVGYPLGQHPGGYLGFTPTRFWVMLVDTTRKAPATAAMTDVEAISLMKSHAAYSAKYDVDPTPTPDGIKVRIYPDAASNQALVGTTRTFYMRVDGNKLTLKSPGVVIPTTGLTSIVQLELVKVD